MLEGTQLHSCHFCIDKLWRYTLKMWSEVGTSVRKTIYLFLLSPKGGMKLASKWSLHIPCTLYAQASKYLTVKSMIVSWSTMPSSGGTYSSSHPTLTTRWMEKIIRFVASQHGWTIIIVYIYVLSFMSYISVLVIKKYIACERGGMDYLRFIHIYIYIYTPVFQASAQPG